VKELVIRIAQALVDQPEKVEVTEVQGSQCTIIELKVAKSEVGKIIGRHGRTAQAIRTILQAGSSKLNKRTLLEIIEEKDEPFQIPHEGQRQAIAIEVKRRSSSFAQHSIGSAI
jgi:predicted RNA-binding protein YlqC (UPF0109 family)